MRADERSGRLASFLVRVAGVRLILRFCSGLFKSKTKLISVRVSAEELSAFRQACVSEGFASLSDLTRTAVQEFIAGRSAGGQPSFEREMNRLSELIEKLDRDLRELGLPAASPVK